MNDFAVYKNWKYEGYSAFKFSTTRMNDFILISITCEVKNILILELLINEEIVKTSSTSSYFWKNQVSKMSIEVYYILLWAVVKNICSLSMSFKVYAVIWVCNWSKS